MAIQRVAVVGGNAVWRKGVGSVLEEAGFSPMDAPSLPDWKPGRSVVAVIARVTGEPDLAQLATATDAHRHLPILAVVPVIGLAEFAAVVKAGAVSAVDDDASAQELVTTLHHVLSGRGSAPVEILRALAARVAAGFGEMLHIDENDQQRLQLLAQGRTVAELADLDGYSEREMFRTLKDLYTRIGVTSRTEAIVWASRYGVLDPSDAAGQSAR